MYIKDILVLSNKLFFRPIITYGIILPLIFIGGFCCIIGIWVCRGKNSCFKHQFGNNKTDVYFIGTDPVRVPKIKPGKVGQVKKQFEINTNPIRMKPPKPKSGKVGQLTKMFEV